MSRGARFVWVGAAGFGVQMLGLHVLAAAGVPYPFATAMAVEAAILHNFLWHERWTWADRRVPAGRFGRLLRFNGATGVVSIAGNVALMAIFIGWLHLPLLAANLIAVLSLSGLNFVAADRLVFTGGSEDRGHVGLHF